MSETGCFHGLETRGDGITQCYVCNPDLVLSTPETGDLRMSVPKDKLSNVSEIETPGELSFFIGYFMRPENHTLDGRIIPAHMRMQITTAGGIVDFSPQQVDRLWDYLNSMRGIESKK